MDNIDAGSTSVGGIKALRAMRCLRPLRMISRNAGMKMVVNSLLRALPGVANVVLVMISLMLIFGILGVQLFMGRLAQCVVTEGARTSIQCEEFSAVHLGDAYPVEFQTQCVLTSIDTRQACEALAEASSLTLTTSHGGSLYAWKPPPGMDFDNIWNAALVLFEMSSLEAWPDVAWHASDTVGIDMAPRRDASTGYVYFFLAWIFVEAFLRQQSRHWRRGRQLQIYEGG